MIQSQTMRVQLILFTFWSVSSCSVLQKTESMSPAGTVNGEQNFKNYDEQNGDINLRLELDLLHTKTQNCVDETRISEKEGNVITIGNKQADDIENLNSSLSVQISKVSELEGKVFSIKSENINLKEQVDNVENQVLKLNATCQQKLISTVPEVEGKVISMENEIMDLKLQVKEMKDLMYNLSTQISRISELEEKVIGLKSENANLKEQADKALKQVVDQTCQVNISKPVSINGLNEQIMKDIKSGDWNKTATLMRRYLNHSTLAYEQLNNITEYKHYPLEAAKKGYVELIQIMLDNGLPINNGYSDDNNMTMLHKAAAYKQCKLVYFLIQRGADVNVRELRDYTPLHYAAYNYDDVKTVQLLVDSGADIDAQDHKHNYKTALHWAAEEGHESVVQYLVNKGCNTTITNRIGKTAADVAKTWKIKDIIQKKS